MEQSTPSRRAVRFGVFEADFRVGELRKNALKLKLQEQPFQVLALLLERPGDLVTREELRKKLWPHDTFVDFDHGINLAIYKLREALNDSAEKPRFIETLDRRGYRFIFPVESIEFEETPRPVPRPPTSIEVSPIPPVSDAPPQHGGAALQATPPRSIGRSWTLRVGLTALIGVLAFLVWKYVISPPRAGKIMMAVLPFENLSGDKEQEYFSDGLTEETIAQLGGLEPERLGVIARTSAMQYKGTNKRTDQIGRELGVDYILEGSVRRAGGRVRITAQLIQVSDQTHLWANSYERDLRDVLALQSEVAQAIAHRIQINLTPQQKARLSSPHSVNPDAYEAYLKGRFFWNKRYETADGLKKSVEYFQDAAQKDSDFALAYAGLADSYSLLGSNPIDELPPREARPKAKAAAERAVELDDSLAEAHTSLASVKLSYEWDMPGAEREFKRAIELNPNYPTAHQWYGSYLMAMGRLDEALVESEHALALDPLSLVINIDLGKKFYMARQYDQAIGRCRKTIELNPDLYLTHYILGMALEQRGMYPEAISEFQQGKTLSRGSPIMVMALGHAYAASGNPGGAQRALGELQALSTRRYVPALYIAALYTALGDKNQAFQWLQQALGERSDQLVFLKMEPMSDSLRSDRRFQDLVRRIGLAP
jgi:TolB-like protein/DNA-binding winged helix-turn-helix (wHTH) protein/Flp pilus assembly protein TadD